MRLFLTVAVAAIAASGVAAAEEVDAFDFEFTAIDGAPLPLAGFEGSALLVVNTASLCGFTPQYDGLQSLYEAHKDEGLVVIGAPSDDFGGQEYDDNGEIRKFCETNFNISFPLTEKVDVVGDGAHPFFKWAKVSLGEAAEPKWNFHKILIGRDGKAIAAFPSKEEPTGQTIQKAVADALAGAPSSDRPDL